MSRFTSALTRTAIGTVALLSMLAAVAPPAAAHDESTIHDHDESDCGFLVIAGAVEETRYRPCFFVPEGEGRAIERERGGNLDVKVAIDEFGNAVIKTLLIDGAEVEFH